MGVSQAGRTELEGAIQYGPQSINDHSDGHVVEPQLPRQSGLQNTGVVASRPPHSRVGRPKQSQGGSSDRGGEVGNAGIVACKGRALFQDCGQLQQRYAA